MSTIKPPCRHCHRRLARPGRGLCWKCHARPEVRVLYPCLVSQRRPESQGGHPLPSEPTTATPGSPEKIAVLETRASLGLSLFHPSDPALVHDRRRGVRVFHLAIEKA